MSKNKVLPKDQKHLLWRGIKFLGRSLFSQWKVLVTITFIFFIFMFVLAVLTFGLDQCFSGDQFSGEIHAGNKLTFFDSFWWVFDTMSTVGYGDIYPITTIMRTWAIFIGIIGISFLALFTAVVVNGFTIEFQRRANPEDYADMQNFDEMRETIKKLEKENKDLRSKLEVEE